MSSAVFPRMPNQGPSKEKSGRAGARRLKAPSGATSDVGPYIARRSGVVSPDESDSGAHLRTFIHPPVGRREQFALRASPLDPTLNARLPPRTHTIEAGPRPSGDGSWSASQWKGFPPMPSCVSYSRAFSVLAGVTAAVAMAGAAHAGDGSVKPPNFKFADGLVGFSLASKG